MSDKKSTELKDQIEKELKNMNTEWHSDQDTRLCEVLTPYYEYIQKLEDRITKLESRVRTLLIETGNFKA